MQHANTTGVRLTEEAILDHIRTLRNNLIKDFLDERFLISYFSEVYNRKELTTVKVEFIKRDLKEMLIHPVDLNHYKELITQLRETNAASLTEKNEKLFYTDVEKVFRRYT
ncbi:MAG TPA: hypothetical protein PLV21_14025 [Cyclobacteriaceae bacterium]|nr:hypothetical protein [Cyclobacteriaceae bacterium]HRJ83003.1 hypothetical protein [Cyclobacteriaceae bacterium]